METLSQVKKTRRANVDRKLIINPTCGSDGASLRWHVGRFKMQLTENVQSGQNKYSDKMVVYITLSHN